MPLAQAPVGLELLMGQCYIDDLHRMGFLRQGGSGVPYKPRTERPMEDPVILDPCASEIQGK